MSTESPRYTTVAVILHWLIAVMLAGQIFGGWLAADESTPRAQAFQLFQLHKSFGLTILALSVARLVWRLSHKVPPMPETMAGWERAAARGVHFLFYVLIIAMPLSGWALISSAPYTVTTMYFGLFEVPLLPVLSGSLRGKEIHELLESAHSALVWITIGLLLLHVGAALKHHFVNRDGVLARMLPFLKAAAP
jgi:cytochrome b561